VFERIGATSTRESQGAAVRLGAGMGTFEWSCGHWEAGRQILATTVALAESALEQGGADLLPIIGSSVTWAYLEELTTGIVLLPPLLELARRLTGAESRVSLKVIHEVSVVESVLGRRRRALEIAEDGLRTAQRVCGPTDELTLSFVKAVSDILRHSKRTVTIN